MQYHFRIHEEENGLWAECLELEGCVTQGNGRADLYENMLEVLDLYLDEPNDANIAHPLPDESIVGENIVEVPVSVNLALPIMLRAYRLANHLSVDQAKDALGFTHRTKYARLERRCNPTLTTINQIVEAFPDFPIERCYPRSA